MTTEQEFRDQITADFKAGKIGIENGWLFEYTEPCPYPCAGPEYGCPPSCYTVPIADLWLETNLRDQLARAEATIHMALAATKRGNLATPPWVIEILESYTNKKETS